MNVTVTMPVRTYSTLNQRECWQARARRAKQERMLAHFHTPRGLSLPLVVTLTRIAPRELDSDNLAASSKGVRDGIADRLGINDRHPSVTWRYAQRKGKPKQYAVEVQFEEAA